MQNAVDEQMVTIDTDWVEDLELKILRGFYSEICGIPAVYDVQNLLARRMVEQIRRHTSSAGIPEAPAANPTVLDALNRDGCFVIGPTLSPPAVAEIRARASGMKVFNGEMYDRSDGIPHDLAALRHAYRLGGYKISDILRLPHLLEIANDAPILAVAENYLGCCPTIALMSLWWSFPEQEAGETLATELIGQRFHRDVDDFRAITFFIYLTDVDADRGAQRYLRTSHDLERTRNLLASGRARHPETGQAITLTDTFARSGIDVGQGLADAFPELIAQIEGPAGTGFLTDTHGLHCGTGLRRGERLLFVVRYGVANNMNHTHLRGFVPPRFSDFAHRIGDTEKSRYVNRVLLA